MLNDSDQARAGRAAASTNAGRARIKVNGARKTYQTQSGSVDALAETTFTMDTGEFVSVLGPSGCGKSTLLTMMAGLTPTSGGSIVVDGREVTEPYPDLGVVFQRDLLMPWRRVKDNVLIQAEYRHMPRDASSARADELLAMVGLSDFADKYPHELSGGMRQRVAICRALLHDPGILFMDEPFGALDALSRDQLNLDLQQIWSGSKKSVFFVTHSIPEAIFLSDRVLVLGPRPGRMLDDIRIDLERPRELGIRETPRFAEYTKHIREVFESSGILH